ncbi:MAG: YcjF family protein [Methylococcales bacterium]|nr:YcjF family protein [Methylococcales bacterium]
MTENMSEEIVPVCPEERLREAEHLVRMGMYCATGVGLVPLPVVDLVGVTGIQLDLLRRLSNLYGVKFSKDAGKNVIASLIGGGVSFSVGPLLGSMVKVIPLVGPVLGAISMSATSGATTYALGKVFIEHFESGGTILTFNPKAVKAFYEAQVKEGSAILAKTKMNEQPVGKVAEAK